MARELVQKAFYNNKVCSKGNHSTRDGEYYLFNNRIMWKENNDIYISACGHLSKTTKNTLGELGIRIYQKNKNWFLKDGIAWNGESVNYSKLTPPIIKTKSIFE